MEKLSMCRICLVEDVKMYSLMSANLQALYERLTDMPFVTNDKKPVQVCYLCRARLQNCHRLQATCLRSEEFFNTVMVNNELKQMESQDLNTLKTVHPLIHISCVPVMRMDSDDEEINENIDFKFDPLEIAPDARVKEEFFEDDSFTNETVVIKLEPTEEQDICTEYGDVSDNSHLMLDTQLEHDIQQKTIDIVLDRIHVEQFEIGTFAAENPKIDLLNGNTEGTILVKPETEVTVVQNNNTEEKIQSIERAVVVENKNNLKQISFIDRHIKKRVNKNKKEYQKRYREQNREKLKQREAERRKRIQRSKCIAGPSTSSNTNILEVNNEKRKITALQRNREYQRRYRERIRDKLKQLKEKEV